MQRSERSVSCKGTRLGLYCEHGVPASLARAFFTVTLAAHGPDAAVGETRQSRTGAPRDVRGDRVGTDPSYSQVYLHFAVALQRSGDAKVDKIQSCDLPLRSGRENLHHLASDPDLDFG